MSSIDRKDLESWISKRRPDFEAALKKLVEIPSISMDPERNVDSRRCAEAAAALIRAEGGDAQVCDTAGNPCVVGGFLGDPSWPTVTIYNHLDVQPANEDSWKQEPFTMTNQDGVYGGRGTTDDKGPALTALFAASYARAQGLPINIRLLWEGEEEIGSPSFDAFLQAKAPEIPTDSVLVSDTIWVSRKKPAVSTGLRGLQAAILTLETGSKGTHSGLTGGLARNPIAELAAVAHGCVDARTGRIKIKGFYDDVDKPSAKELKNFEASGFSLTGFKKAHGLKKLRHDTVKKATQSIWALPTFEIHGMNGGYQGPGVMTVVPDSAELKVSMRLVPNQTPAKALRMLKAHVKQLNPDVKVSGEAALEPYRGPSEGRLADAAVAALEFGFGKTPAFVREGGSIGAVVTMKKRLKCPISFIGLSLPEHGYHAPNENFDWIQAEGGMKTFVRYLELLSS
jgi:acetylornithine deacetylase/succinyl-diaminopimelate desuccinylase-like protein